MRRAAKRDTSEKAIVDTLRACGCTVEYLSGKDMPDLLIGTRGITYLAEVKTGTKKLKPGQDAWRKKWRGQPVLVLRTADDALALVKANG